MAVVLLMSWTRDSSQRTWMGQMMGDWPHEKKHRGALLYATLRDLEAMLMIEVLWYFDVLVC